MWVEAIRRLRLEHFHAARAAGWALFGAYVFLFRFDLASSVAIVFLLSVYANVESAWTNYSARKAQREAKEAESS